MIKTAICFTGNGKEVIEKLNKAYAQKGMEGAGLHMFPGEDSAAPSAEEFVRSEFERGHALIFTGACGIAVRLISGCVRDKLTDSPVIVIDDAGSYVIPILSGHAGGANKLAVTIASLIGAIPVITTSTDVNGAFSADVFAAENGLRIRNRDGIRKVSAKAIEGKSVTISVKDYPPADPVDIIIADETDSEYSLLLSPRSYVIGVGTRKGIDADIFERNVMSTIQGAGITIDEVYALATIDIKEKEPAIREFTGRYRIPLITFEADVLKRCKGNFTSSGFVEETVGVDNVCERAAILAAGCGSKLIVPKTAGDGVTVSVAKRRQG